MIDTVHSQVAMFDVSINVVSHLVLSLWRRFNQCGPWPCARLLALASLPRTPRIAHESIAQQGWRGHLVFSWTAGIVFPGLCALASWL